MRPITNSSSCNTLIDVSSLEEDYTNKAFYEDSSDVHDLEFVKTELLLDCDEHDGEDDEDRHLYLPKSATGSSLIPIDKFLSGIPAILESSETMLTTPPCDLTKNKKRKILNVCQGEMGHAVTSQCDVMVSDDATTCHIVALRSRVGNHNDTITSMTHIDQVGYENCIRDMFARHQSYHHDDNLAQQHLIHMDLHIMGGFDDVDGSSREISEYLLTLFCDIATDLKHFAVVTLKTCLITSLNDDGACCPVGRGLGVDVHTGEAFLISHLHTSLSGPELALRFARGWAGAETDILSLVHDVTSEGIIVRPFPFRPFRDLDALLKLPDNLMLKYTSTSPDVEKDNFCHNLRRTLVFMKTRQWQSYFGERCDRPAVFERGRGVDMNEWKMV